MTALYHDAAFQAPLLLHSPPSLQKRNRIVTKRTSMMHKGPTPSRRDMLISLAALTLPLPLNASPANAYSSPYKPSQQGEKVLPDRLYESAVNRVITTKSGLQYFDLSQGEGVEAKAGSTASVQYTSRLRGLNGIKVWSSYDDASARPFVFTVGATDVVPGVSEAVAGMRVGGKRRAVLPPNIAYSSPDMQPRVVDFFARRRLLSVLETQRDATIVFE